MLSNGVSPVLKSKFPDRCESIAVRLRHELKLLGYEPLPSRRLASHKGTDLLALSDLPDLDQESLSKAMGSSRWSAITVLTNPPTVVYHPAQIAAEFEFTVMHELAHLLLDHKPEYLGRVGDHRVARNYSKRQEFEADFLAGCLLIPRVGLHYVRGYNLSSSQMAEYFNAPLRLVVQREKVITELTSA